MKAAPTPAPRSAARSASAPASTMGPAQAGLPAEAGRAPAWVLLRGLTRGSGHWGSFAAALQAAQPGLLLLTPDLPGNGARWRERSPASVPALLAEVRRTVANDLAAAGHAGPVRLLAMSLGAMLACEWACQYPGELAGAVLINTSLRPFSRPWQRLRPAAAARLLGLALSGASAEAWERGILQLTSRLAAADQHRADRVLAHWLALRQQHPVRAGNALRQLLAAARFSAAPRAPSVPLLVLVSGADALVDPACSRQLAQRWGSHWQEHPNAGHDLPLDAPDWVLAQLLAWVAAH